MIVSHKHRFIFVHLGRTGGRSITAALAPFCGPDDIITSCTPTLSGERQFTVVGQNCDGLSRHVSAVEIRRHVGEDVFNSYFKFTFERNPWDKILSRYWAYAGQTCKKRHKEIYTKITGRKASFKTWFRLRVVQGYLFGLGHIRLLHHYKSYTDKDRVCVDFIGRAENRDEHLRMISERIGLPIRNDIRLGGTLRKDRRPYTEFYDPWMCRMVEKVYRQDLALLGYRFGVDPPMDPIEGDTLRIFNGDHSVGEAVSDRRELISPARKIA